MNKKYTKRALFASVMALILCCAMLVGTTMAWFTDTAYTRGNKIQAGNLDVDLLVLNTDNQTWTSIANENAPLFAYENWEPGYTQVKVLRVVNNGTLALKWKAMLIAEAELSDLADVIDVRVMEMEEGKASYPTSREEVENWKRVGTLKDFVAGIETTTVGEILPGKGENLGIAFTMQETAGNDYQGMNLGGAFDICITATQLSEESDSFGKDYDEDAEFADGLNADTGTSLVNDGGVLSITEPVTNKGNAGNYAVITKNNGVTRIDADVTSLGGGVAVADGSNVVFNSGSVYVDTDSSSGRYIFYLQDAGSELTINDGDFSWDPKDNNKRAYVYASAGTTVTINGGNFGKASTRDKYNAGIMGDGTVIIKGGTFGFNPSNWVAPGYKAEMSGSDWVVSAE